MLLKNLYTLIFFFLLSFCAKAQNDADDYFRAEQYAKAAQGFEKQLSKKKNIATKAKLAYCYRMTNQLEKSLELYRQLAQNERAKADVYYYLAEAWLQKEAYDSAQIWLSRYLSTNPKEDLGAARLLKNLQVIQTIKPYFTDIVTHSFSNNSDADDNSATVIDGKVYFASDRNSGFKMLKEKSGTTGRDFLNLYVADIDKDTFFAKVKPVSELNILNSNTGAISITADEKFAYFERNNSAASKKGVYHLALFRAESDAKGGWRNIEKLPFCDNETSFMHPSISPDGSELFFVATHTGQKTDIFYTQLDANGTWRPTQGIGNNINTEQAEGFPFMDRAGRLYFASKGHAGYGGFDLFVSERDATGQWTSPLNLGKPINSSLDDIAFGLFRNGTSGTFSSSRDGGDDDIYFFRHKDSLSFFEKKLVQNEPSFNIDTVAKSTLAPKDSIKKIEVTASTATPDFCEVYNYCSLEDLSAQMQQLVRDTAQWRDSSFFKKSYILPQISFDDKNNIVQDSATNHSLMLLTDFLNQHSVNVLFSVHSGGKGKGKENLEITKKRGIKLLKFLQEQGINRERLKSKGMGETQPICQGEDCVPYGKKSEMINERISIQIIRKK